MERWTLGGADLDINDEMLSNYLAAGIFFSGSICEAICLTLSILLKHTLFRGCGNSPIKRFLFKHVRNHGFEWQIYSCLGWFIRSTFNLSFKNTFLKDSTC